MDELPKADVDSVEKVSTTRLVNKLTNAGYSIEDIEQMNREATMETWARCIIDGIDKRDTTSAGAASYDSLEREKLVFEKQKFDAEQDIRLHEAALKEAGLKILEQKRC